MNLIPLLKRVGFRAFLPVAITSIGVFSGSWFILQYCKPLVVCFTDGYYSRIDNLSIGSIYLFNEGRSPENNLSVSLNENIPATDISVDYLSTKANITNDNNVTRITLPKLKPKEYAEIVLRSRKGNRVFEIEDITSESGNIRYEEWIRKPWHNLSNLEIGSMVFAVTIAFVFGCFIGNKNRKPDAVSPTKHWRTSKREGLGNR